MFVGVGTTTATGIGVGSRVGVGIEVGITSCDGNGKLRTTLIARSNTTPSMAATPQLLSLDIYLELGRTDLLAKELFCDLWLCSEHVVQLLSVPVQGCW